MHSPHRQGSGKKALIFWPYNPYPPITGTHSVQLADMEALRKLGYDITIFSSAGSTDSSGATWNNAAELALCVRFGIKLHLYEFSLIDRLYMHRQFVADPQGWDQCTSPWYVRDFHSMCHRLMPDVVLIHYPSWSKLAMGDDLGGAIKMVRSHDLLARNEAMLRFVSPYLPPHVPPERLDPEVLQEDFYSRRYHELKGIESLEFSIYDEFDITASVSPHDTAVIRENTSRTRTHHIPHSFATVPLNNSYNAAPLLVVSNYPLNIQGYYYFSKRVLPLILRRIPGFSLRVAGKACEKVVPVRGIELLHYVPDLKPLYASARFAVCPVIGGTGIQIKIVEAMAHGVPAIALSAIARSSPIQHGVNGFVAQNAEEFAEYAVRLSLDKDLCRKLGDAARAAIAERFSPDDHAARWAAAIAEIENPMKPLADPDHGGRVVPAIEPAKKKTERAARSAMLEGSPKISVITPAYNCAKFIRTCIESVLAQGYDNFEHIVIDGASSDNTVEILKSYPHIRWVSERDEGEADALNKALRLVTGDIVCWLNADDWLLPGVFNAVIEEFERSPGPCVVYGNTNMMDEAGRFLVLKRSAPRITLEFLARWWRCGAHPHQPSMFFSKAVIEDVGPFRQDLYFSVDYEYWLRTVVKYPFRYVDRVFSAARMRADSKGLDTEAGQIQSHWKVSLPYHHRLSPNDRREFWAEYYLHRLFERKDPEAARQPDCAEASVGLAFALLRAAKMDEAFCALFPDAPEQAAVKKTLCRFILEIGAAHRTEMEKLLDAIGAGAPALDKAVAVPVLWSGPVFDPSGYADQARNFIKGIGADWPLFLRPAGDPDREFVSGMQASEYRDLESRTGKPGVPYVSILSMPAYAFERDPDALYNVGKTAFETDRLSHEWVLRCNQMDEVWVPTRFNAETFRQSGVKVPLVVIPEGVDPCFYRPGLAPLAIPGRRGFAFLSIFEWTYRKGWDLLLRAWAEAFSPDDDVCLILRSHPVKGDKTTPRGIRERVNAYYESIGLSAGKIAPVIVMEDHVPQRQMPNLYASADAFVLPTRGEGWGRPYIESMSCGLPVIGTRWGGNLEYMDRDNSYLIDIKGLEPVDGKMELPFYRGHSWSSPSTDHLVPLMKEVFSNREAARLKGEKARQDVIARWTWKTSSQKAVDRIRQISAAINGKSTKSLSPALRLCWEGSQLVGHSLALINRELCLQLIDRGFEVSIVTGDEPEDIDPCCDPRFEKIVRRTRKPLSGGTDVYVRHHWPPNFDPPNGGRWVIIQPWEYGRLPESWVEPMANLVDEIWVPSRHVLRTCIASGVPADRVQVVPNGVNADLFHPGAAKRPIKSSKKFKFLFVGGGLWRKGVDILLDAYRSQFRSSDDVVLIIKDLPHQKIYIDQGAGRIIRQIQADPRAPEIVHMQAALSPQELPGLYTASDCLVHPYRGEGFGLPVLEAMACGVPVITTAGGATDDFCSPDEVFLIPSEHREFNPKDIKLAGGAGWVLEPDLNELKALMREAFENRAWARERALRVSEHVRAGYGWKVIAEKVSDRIYQLVQKPVRRRQA